MSTVIYKCNFELSCCILCGSEMVRHTQADRKSAPWSNQTYYYEFWFTCSACSWRFSPPEACNPGKPHYVAPVKPAPEPVSAPDPLAQIRPVGLQKKLKDAERAMSRLRRTAISKQPKFDDTTVAPNPMGTDPEKPQHV
jgi:hypothetical protein